MGVNSFIFNMTNSNENKKYLDTISFRRSYSLNN